MVASDQKHLNKMSNNVGIAIVEKRLKQGYFSQPSTVSHYQPI